MPEIRAYDDSVVAVLWWPRLNKFIAIPQWYLSLKVVNVRWHWDIAHRLSTPSKEYKTHTVWYNLQCVWIRDVSRV